MTGIVGQWQAYPHGLHPVSQTRVQETQETFRKDRGPSGDGNQPFSQERHRRPKTRVTLITLLRCKTQVID